MTSLFSALTTSCSPGRKKAGRWDGQSALGPMCDAEKDWHERSFRASGAINGCQKSPLDPSLLHHTFLLGPARFTALRISALLGPEQFPQPAEFTAGVQSEPVLRSWPADQLRRLDFSQTFHVCLSSWTVCACNICTFPQHFTMERKFFVGGNWKMNGSKEKIDGILKNLAEGSLSPSTGLFTWHDISTRMPV